MKIHRKLAIVSFIQVVFLLLHLSLCAQNFQDITVSAGVNFAHDGNPASNFTHSIGSGAAWIDYDNDGDLDLYYTMRQGANYMFRNNGDETFTDVATSIGADDAAGDGAGVSVADFNNDGWEDLFLANNVGCKLLKNNGGTFTDITASAGIGLTGNSRATSATWGDYDNDGFLDLYIVHHDPIDWNIPNYSTQDYLLYNNGDETFTDVSTRLGIDNLIGSGFIGGWTDFDRDNDLDIILVNDCPIGPTPRETKVFRNDGGTNALTWNFTEVSVAVGIDDCRSGMGIAIGDYNRDSYFDIAYTNVGESVMFKNTNGTFSDVTSATGIGGQPNYYFSWATFFFDYDLDGWEDLFIASGALHHPASLIPMNNNLFQNNGNGTFSDVAPSQNMDDTDRSRNAIVGDFDNDGDEDMFIVNYDAMPLLKKNNNAGNNYLKIKLTGTISNKNGIGAKLKLTLGNGIILYKETHCSQGYGGSNTPFVHFGLGTQTNITSLEVKWPSGTNESFSGLSANTTQYYTEGTGAALPIELISFDVSKNNDNGVDLFWQTVSEKNSEHFIIQKSTNGKNFEDIGTVPAKGFSNELVNYSFYDDNPVKSLNYYRLKLSDFDETFSFSQIRTITFSNSQNKITIFPNLISNSQIPSLSFNSKFEGKIIVQILDSHGKRIFHSTKFYDNQSISLKEVRWSSLPASVYYVQVYDLENQSFYTKKIMTKK